MKRLIFLAALGIMCACAVSSQAQPLKAGPVREIKVDTLTNTDTASLAFNSIGSNVVSFTVVVKKVSGTVGGKVYLQATNDGVEWEMLDSLTNSNVATNIKTVLISRTSYNSYRAYYTTSGTQSSVLRFVAVRRPDEN